MGVPLLFFWLLAAISLGSAILVVANQNPVRSALFLVVKFFVLAVFYFTLGAEFVGSVQIIFYAGAIMVLFLFVIMLLNLGAPEALKESGRLGTAPAIVVGLIFLSLLSGVGAIDRGLPPVSTKAAQFMESGGTPEQVGIALFNPSQPWLFPFEVTSFLLLIGVVGAVVLAKRRI
jgi:NADH-quinone oxidoreductase subunit J